jgi:hypothetical protein
LRRAESAPHDSGQTFDHRFLEIERHAMMDCPPAARAPKLLC